MYLSDVNIDLKCVVSCDHIHVTEILIDFTDRLQIQRQIRKTFIIICSTES